MIGKMYRPLKILNISGKRGYTMLNKYKSNFGGTTNFELEVYLHYNADHKTENIILNFLDLPVPIMLVNGHQTKDGSFVHSIEEREVLSLRKMIRPKKITSKVALEMTILIESPKDEAENDVLVLSLVPELDDKGEFMKVEITCNTPVMIKANSDVFVGK